MLNHSNVLKHALISVFLDFLFRLLSVPVEAPCTRNSGLLQVNPMLLECV